MLTIAVDAMGGDHAPKSEVEGAVAAARDLGIKVILVGQQELVRKELSQHHDSAQLPYRDCGCARTHHHGRPRGARRADEAR